MPSRPWYRWYPGDYLADTQHLTLEQDAVYRRILDLLWSYDSLPCDLISLGKLCRIHPNKLRGIWPHISPYMSRDTSGDIFHPKMREQRAQLSETSEKRRDAANKRWHAKADAKASNARSARARPDPDPDLKTCSPRSDPNLVARASDGNEKQKKRISQSGREATIAALAEWAEQRGISAPGLESDARPVRAVVVDGVRQDADAGVAGCVGRLECGGSSEGTEGDG